MDYSNYLVMYSGGADSTHFIEKESSAKHLIHYISPNQKQTNIARVNANLLNRFLELVPFGVGSMDGETNQIHALLDTQMVLDACVKAVAKGMKGVVVCFTADDIGIDVDALLRILHRVDQSFEILLPLKNETDKSVRASLTKSGLRYVSCMLDDNCGYCAKCKKSSIAP